MGEIAKVSRIKDEREEEEKGLVESYRNTNTEYYEVVTAWVHPRFVVHYDSS